MDGSLVSLLLENGKVEMKTANECVCCADCMAICPEKAIELASLNRFGGYYKIINKGKSEKPIFL